MDSSESQHEDDTCSGSSLQMRDSSDETTYGRSMRGLLIIVVLGLVVAGVIWTVQRYRDSRSASMLNASLPEPPSLDRDVIEPATVAFGPERGQGTLRLTPSQLIFTGDSGRVLVLERIGIVGVSATRELPDGQLARSVLAVTTRTETHYFAVSEPEQWAQWLV